MSVQELLANPPPDIDDGDTLEIEAKWDADNGVYVFCGPKSISQAASRIPPKACNQARSGLTWKA